MLDDRIARVKDLIAKREEIDAELSEMLGVEQKQQRKCRKCGQPGHRADSCTTEVPTA